MSRSVEEDVKEESDRPSSVIYRSGARESHL